MLDLLNNTHSLQALEVMDRVNHEKLAAPSKAQAILPTQAAVQNISLKDIVNDGIATELYVDFNKIGEGYVFR